MDPRIISKEQFVQMTKAPGYTGNGGSRASYAFRRGGSFDLLTMPDGQTFGMVAHPEQLTDEQLKEIDMVLPSETPPPATEDIAPQIA